MTTLSIMDNGNLKIFVDDMAEFLDELADIRKRELSTEYAEFYDALSCYGTSSHWGNGWSMMDWDKWDGYYITDEAREDDETYEEYLLPGDNLWVWESITESPLEVMERDGFCIFAKTDVAN